MAEKMTLERAEELMNGYHCSQSVIYYGAEKLGFDKDLLLKMSSSLGGGCLNGEVCGCVTGAILTLGSKYGYCEYADGEQDAICKAKVNEFIARFRKKHGAICCKDLLGGYSMGVPEEAKYIAENSLWSKCPALVLSTCEMLDDLLED